jgi:hypothetical protein
VLRREPISIDDFALYPLFDDELLALMRRLIPPEKHHAVGIAVIVRARCAKTKPNGSLRPLSQANDQAPAPRARPP